MTAGTGTYENTSINYGNHKYNNVSKPNVSGASSTAVERLGEAAAARNRRIQRERAGAPVIVKEYVKTGSFPVRFVFYALVATLMLMFIVYTNSVVNEISYDISDLEAKISMTKAENEKLSIELDKKYDLKYIEDVAVNKLGLVKSTEVVKHYVNISGGSDVVIANRTNSAATTISATLDSFKESVANIYQ